MASNKIYRILLKDIGCGIFLSAGSILLAGVILVASYLLASIFGLYWPIAFLYLLHPINQGLSDHVAFGSTLLFSLSSLLLVCAFFVPHFRHLFTHKTPWLIAGTVGALAGLIMLVDMRLNTDYQLYRSIGTVLIMQTMVVIMVFLFHWLRDNDNNRQHSHSKR